MMALMYSFVYLLYSTYVPHTFPPSHFPSTSNSSLSFVFGRQYHWNESQTGLAFFGLGGGSILGLYIYFLFSDPITKLFTKRYGIAKPEYRLVMFCVSQFLMPIGLLVYGWSAQYTWHWYILHFLFEEGILIERSIPIAGTFILGLGTSVILVLKLLPFKFRSVRSNFSAQSKIISLVFYSSNGLFPNV